MDDRYLKTLFGGIDHILAIQLLRSSNSKRKFEVIDALFNLIRALSHYAIKYYDKD